MPNPASNVCSGRIPVKRLIAAGHATHPNKAPLQFLDLSIISLADLTVAGM
jgi:hypothetical protein